MVFSWGLMSWIAVMVLMLFALISWQRPRWQWPYTALVCLSLGLSAIYLGWRLTATLDWSTGADAVASLLLLAAELAGIFQFAVFDAFMYRHYRRPIPAWPDDRDLPSVDVFIATYNESPQLLKKTLAACHRIQYPRTLLSVYVCDDGARHEVEQLAARWDCHYLARPDHDHAKAGNLNYALAHSTGEYIVTLDADMVPKPGIIRTMIGFFSDPQMAFVQAPQVFYNPDPYQHNLPFGHLRNNDQDYFMREMLPRRDRLGAVMYIGSNAMFSRAALRAVGGFSTGSITEDLATGLVLQSRKFHTAYCDAVVAAGLAPETFAELVNQRTRWGRGNIQVFQQHSMLGNQGLTGWQRVGYLSGTLYWYFGVQKLIFVSMPLLFIFFGVIALHTTLSALVLMWVPYFLGQVLTFKRLSQRKSNVWWSHVQELALMPFLAVAALAETFRISMKHFHVTTKGVVSHRGRVTKYFWTLLAVTLVTVAGFMVGVSQWASDRSGLLRHSLEISLLWDGFNMLGLIFATIGAYEKPRPRTHERQSVGRRGHLQLGHDVYAVTVADLSESGFRLNGVQEPHDLIGRSGQLMWDSEAFPVVIAQCRRQHPGTPWDVAGTFQPLSSRLYERLVYEIYGRVENSECPDLGSLLHQPEPASGYTVSQSSSSSSPVWVSNEK